MRDRETKGEVGGKREKGHPMISWLKPSKWVGCQWFNLLLEAS